MVSKKVVSFSGMVGLTVGGYVPTFFGAGAFSFWAISGSLVGGLLFIYLAVKFADYI